MTHVNLVEPVRVAHMVVAHMILTDGGAILTNHEIQMRAIPIMITMMIITLQRSLQRHLRQIRKHLHHQLRVEENLKLISSLRQQSPPLFHPLNRRNRLIFLAHLDLQKFFLPQLPHLPLMPSVSHKLCHILCTLGSHQTHSHDGFDAFQSAPAAPSHGGFDAFSTPSASTSHHTFDAFSTPAAPRPAHNQFDAFSAPAPQPPQSFQTQPQNFGNFQSAPQQFDAFSGAPTSFTHQQTFTQPQPHGHDDFGDFEGATAPNSTSAAPKPADNKWASLGGLVNLTDLNASAPKKETTSSNQSSTNHSSFAGLDGFSQPRQMVGLDNISIDLL